MPFIEIVRSKPYWQRDIGNDLVIFFVIVMFIGFVKLVLENDIQGYKSTGKKLYPARL